ncbi:hypothetical protein CHS0354_016708 [Potamilus streckersoni]|uniref:Uncharacterized protein n=1 Tax=Potamilus streckersoni TaxID=2493646 RepID=A0AAE0TIQ2_9BIVA|nr:hypothetical protein CHS0354_016708 [Potamilus streckersoni]
MKKKNPKKYRCTIHAGLSQSKKAQSMPDCQSIKVQAGPTFNMRSNAFEGIRKECSNCKMSETTCETDVRFKDIPEV